MKKYKIITVGLIVTALLLGLFFSWQFPKQQQHATDNCTIIPRAVYVTALYIEKHGIAPQGYRELSGYYPKRKQPKLPLYDQKGNRIKYIKSDIYPTIRRVNRGPERLVIGNDGNIYYTPDHYDTFIKISSTCFNQFVETSRSFK